MKIKNKNDLISICLIWESPKATNPSSQIEKLCEEIAREYEFFEVLLLINERDFDNNKHVLPKNNNLRFVISRVFDDYYAKRTICAKESIGDIVVVTNINELEFLNFCDLINTALKNDSIIITKLTKAPVLEKIFSPFFLFLGKILRLELKIGILKTIIYPRTKLNTILNQDYEDLKLRFPPSNLDLNVSVISPSSSIYKGYSDFNSRLSLVYKLLLHLTPILLRHLTLVSGLGILISFAYLLYTFGVYLLIDNIQSGWLTLSLSISGTALFLTSATFVLSISIQHILHSTNKEANMSSTYEIGSIDIYKNIKKDLNIELSLGDKKNESKI